MPQAVTNDGVHLVPAEVAAYSQDRAADEFKRIVGRFLAQVDAGRWPKRDPRAVSASITGMQ